MNNEDFPSRDKIVSSSRVHTTSYKDVDYQYLTEQVNNLNLDLDEIDFISEDFDSIRTKVDKQKVYFWIRVYLKEETKIEPGDDIIIKYSYSGEELTTKFICYAKTGGLTTEIANIVNYNSEDDVKVLCLMVDEEKINYESEDIPFLRKLFRIGRFFEYELLRRSDLTLTI